MRLGKLAILFTIAAAALNCSGNPPVSEPGQAALDVPASVVVNAIDHTATPSGTQVVLRGNYPFSFTTYQPDEHTLVVELLEVRAQGVAEEVRLDTPQVENVSVTNVQGVDGGTIAKFEFRNIQAARHAVRLEGNDLVIDFPTLSDAENMPAGCGRGFDGGLRRPRIRSRGRSREARSVPAGPRQPAGRREAEEARSARDPQGHARSGAIRPRRGDTAGGQRHGR
jgi:hypothetical protein